jgi:hypothetical protein
LPPGTHVYQDAGDIADHVMQEGIGADVYVDAIALAADPDEVQEADGTPGLAALGTKRSEIVLTSQMTGGFTHGLHGQGQMNTG